MKTEPDSQLLPLAAQIVAAYVAGPNKLPAEKIGDTLAMVHEALQGLAQGAPVVNREPAVPIAKSVTPNAIICLEDGKKLKMLKRYLRTHFDLSPEEYRRKWGLPADYPMTAPSYAEHRSKLAKQTGLGKR